VLTYIRASLWITKITLKCPTPEKGISTFTKLKISKVLKDTSGPFAVFCYSVFKDRFSPKAAWQTPRMPRRLLRRDAQSIFFPALCQYCFTASHSSLFIPSLSTFPQSSSLPKTAANYTILKGLSTRKNTGRKKVLINEYMEMIQTLRKTIPLVIRFSSISLMFRWSFLPVQNWRYWISILGYTPLAFSDSDGSRTYPYCTPPCLCPNSGIGT